MNIKLSIITPSFNQGQYLEETIDSILSQGYDNVEYFIMDGGSTDNSVGIIKKYERHLAGWVSEKDSGQSHAINKGLARATGDVINWINSDDYLEPGALKTIAKAFEDEKVNVFIGRSNFIENGKIVGLSRGTDVYENNLAKTIGLARIDQPEHWWRKSVIDEIGPLNENLHYIMDRDWWVKYLLTCGLNGIDKSSAVLSNFRLHGNSKTVAQNDSFSTERDTYFATLATHCHLEYKIKNHKVNHRLISDLPSEIDNAELQKALEYHYLLRADEYYVRNDFKTTREVLRVIDPAAFDLDSLTLYRNLNRRSKFPTDLINFVRKLKS